MVSGDPEGSQGVCWRSPAPDVDEREHSAREVWVLLGYGDEHNKFRAHYFCADSRPIGPERGHAGGV
jgi:hypothetical protein